MAVAASITSWPVGAGAPLGNVGPLRTWQTPASVNPVVAVAYGAAFAIATVQARNAQQDAESALGRANDLATQVCGIEEMRANDWIASQNQSIAAINLLGSVSISVISCPTIRNIIGGCMRGVTASTRDTATRNTGRYGLDGFHPCDRAIDLAGAASEDDAAQQYIRTEEWRSNKSSSFRAANAARGHNSASRLASTSNASSLLTLAVGSYNGMYQTASGMVDSFVGIGGAALAGFSSNAGFD